MSVSRGVATINGADNVFFAAVSGDITTHNQSIDHAREADHDLLKDGAGDVVMDFITSKRRTISASVVVYHATSKASANSANKTAMMAPGDKCTLEDTAGAVAGVGPMDGDYLVMTAKERRTNTSHNVIDLELTKWDDHNLTLIPGA